MLALFFQMDKRSILVVIADTEFIPKVYTVQFFPKRLVFHIVKIKTSYQIFSVYGMRIRFHDGQKPLPDGDQV